MMEEWRQLKNRNNLEYKPPSNSKENQGNQRDVETSKYEELEQLQQNNDDCNINKKKRTDWITHEEYTQ